MKLSRTIGLFIILLAAMAHAQSWEGSYSKALSSLKNGDFRAAREGFLAAVGSRAEDSNKPTRLPGPVTEPNFWRKSSPYSANFGAAYAGMKLAPTLEKNEERDALLKQVAGEFESLIAKNQGSRETFYFLAQTYNLLNDSAALNATQQKMQDQSGKFNWKIDTEILTPEEIAMMSGAGTGNTVRPGDLNRQTNPTEPSRTPTNPVNPTNPSTTPTPMPNRTRDQNRYALVIGNSEGKLPDLAVPFAADDAALIKDSLVNSAGFAADHVAIVQNGSAAQMLEAANALAKDIPDGSTVVIFFAGAGANIGGADYLAGVDTEVATDSATMLAKTELFRVFMAKGARIFSFFECQRPISNGVNFGMEVPQVGSVSQMQGTISGQRVSSLTRGGKEVGVFAAAIASVFYDGRGAEYQILEFGWQVFNRMRQGDAQTPGGGSTQTPTLPVRTNMPPDARF